MTILRTNTSTITKEHVPMSMQRTGVDVKLTIVCWLDKSNLDFNIPEKACTIYIHLKEKWKNDNGMDLWESKKTIRVENKLLKNFIIHV